MSKTKRRYDPTDYTLTPGHRIEGLRGLLSELRERITEDHSGPVRRLASVETALRLADEALAVAQVDAQWLGWGSDGLEREVAQ